MGSDDRLRVLQVYNISVAASNDLIKQLFQTFGRIEEFQVYPVLVTAQTKQKVAYVRFEKEKCVVTAQHLTNTVFFDRALVCVPTTTNTIPDEETALLNSAALGKRVLPSHVTNKVEENEHGQKMLYTIDPTLTNLGLPPYPPLGADLDPEIIEQTRRTIYVGNLKKDVNPEDVVKFFNTIGEVMYLRMANINEHHDCAYAYVEFTNQTSVPQALQNDLVEFQGQAIRIQHSRVAIVKPQQKTENQALEEIEEAIRRRDRGEPSPSRRRTRSPSPRRSRRRSPPRRSRSRGRDRDRDRSKNDRRSRDRDRRDRKDDRDKKDDRESRRDRDKDKDKERRRSKSPRKDKDDKKDREKDKDKGVEKSRDSRRSKDRDREREKDKEKKDREKEKTVDKESRPKEKEREKDSLKDKEKERHRDKDKKKDKDREKDKDKEKDRKRSKSPRKDDKKERRRSRSKSPDRKKRREDEKEKKSSRRSKDDDHSSKSKDKSRKLDKTEAVTPDGDEPMPLAAEEMSLRERLLEKQRRKRRESDEMDISD